MTENPVMAAIKRRRSTRTFTRENISKKILATLCEAGLWAPSPSNIQSLRFVVLDGTTEDLEIVKNLAPGFPYEARAAIVICSDGDAAKIFRGKTQEIFCMEETAAAAQNICLAATELNLGSCYVGSFSAGGIHHTLKLPGGIEPILIVALGYPDPQRPAKTPPRRKPEDVIFWNLWR